MAVNNRIGHHGPTVFAGESLVDPVKKPSWFFENIPDVPAEGRELLENYSGIPPDDVIQHVKKIRDQAFAIWPYPCIGQVRFLGYNVPKMPYYDAVLSRLRQNATFVDAGCCFGQDLRFLIHREGISGRQLYGFDLEPGFVKFGQELFCDADRLEATMVSGDLMKTRETETTQELDRLQGRMDIVHVSQVLHVFAWDGMLQATKRLVSLSRPVRGSLVVGNQMGSLNAGEYPMPVGDGKNYRHNEETMEKFWHQVGKETGTEWKVSSGMYETQAIKDNKNAGWAKIDPGMRMIWFSAERI